MNVLNNSVIRKSVNNDNRYRLFGKIYIGGVITAGTAVSVIYWHNARDIWAGIAEHPVYWVFWLAYIGCDFIRLSFQYGSTISLGFPVIFLTLLVGNSHRLPILSFPLVVLGSLMSEVLYTLLRRHMTWGKASLRALFYASHHALSCAGALCAYVLICKLDGWLGLTTIHIQAALVYIVTYAFISMLIILPHDWLISLFFTSDAPFVRVDFSANLLLLPIPTFAFVFYTMSNVDQTIKTLIIIGVMPLLFIMMFLLARDFTKRDELAEQQTLQKKVDQHLGSPVDMTEMAAGIFTAARQFLKYRWGAVYSRFGDTFELYGSEPQLMPNHTQDSDNANCSSETVQDPGDGVALNWPEQLELEDEILDALIQKSYPPLFWENDTAKGAPSALHLPAKTGLMLVPVIGHRQIAPPESAQTVGILLFARPEKRFKLKEWEQSMTLGDKISGMFSAFQHQESRVRGLYHKVQDYASTNQKRVQKAIQTLIRNRVEVGEILEVISERSLYDNPRIILRSRILGEAHTIPTSPEMLREIYKKVQVKTAEPVMPEPGEDILGSLQAIVDSLSAGFALEYQSPSVLPARIFKGVYQFLLSALEAITITRIIALDSELALALDVMQKQNESDLNDRSESESLIAPVRVELENLKEIVNLGKSYEYFGVARDVIAQRSALGKAIDLLTERERIVQSKFLDPEQLFLPQIYSGWRKVLTKVLMELPKGQAQLDVQLRNTRALSLEELTAALLIENHGPGVAYNIAVHLEPSSSCEDIDGHKERGVMLAGQIWEPEFTLCPKDMHLLNFVFSITYDDSEAAGKSTSFPASLYLRQTPGDFAEIPNPYISGPPVKPGNPTFVGRKDIFDFIRQHARSATDRKIIMLVGERRTGKTSILKQLPVWLDDSRYIPIYLDCQGLGLEYGVANFFLWLTQAITDGVEAAGKSCPRLTPVDLAENSQYVFEHRFLPAVLKEIEDYYLLLSIDEFERLGILVNRNILPEDIFDYIRHLAQHGCIGSA